MSCKWDSSPISIKVGARHAQHNILDVASFCRLISIDQLGELLLDYERVSKRGLIEKLLKTIFSKSQADESCYEKTN